jgi:hypothetical protein
LAKNCPIVTSGGGVDVGELTAVPLSGFTTQIPTAAFERGLASGGVVGADRVLHSQLV